MLYERWCRIASERGNEIALHDLVSGRHWTFPELHAAAETRRSDTDEILYLRGHSPEFLFGLLQAWRAGKVVCPLDAGQPPSQIPRPPPPCVHLKSTSATTGQPRWIAFTAEQLQADADHIVATMGLRPDWPNLGVISMAHSYGFSNLVLPLLLHGIPLVLADAALPEALRQAAAMGPSWTLPAVPALWRAWHEARAIPRNVRLAISAGAPLPVSLEQTVFKTAGTKIHNFYGSTECGGIAYDRTATPRADDACIGTALDKVAVSLSEDGCLIVRSDAVGETYWPESAETLGASRFQTSDLAELKNGLVYLRGRASDLINVAGRKVSPETVERALSAHPQIRECLVFGAPDPHAGRTESIVAVVATQATELELKTFLQEKLPAWQVPREWCFVESFGANPRGKISRAKWRRRFLEERKKNP
ncbi:MAG: class I adenylate-forming enzyme family protein [Limisphaerales bacterium]